jgi:hypothetical protein
MGRAVPFRLPKGADGVIRVVSEEVLSELLAHEGDDFSGVSIHFEVRSSTMTSLEARIAMRSFLTRAFQAVVAARLLPAPLDPLPKMGIRVEAAVLGGKPGPSCKYGVGCVEGYAWDPIFQVWRVNVVFDEPAGKWCGMPILGASTFPSLVRVIGSGTRSFSSMTPSEIETVAHRARSLDASRGRRPC